MNRKFNNHMFYDSDDNDDIGFDKKSKIRKYDKAKERHFAKQFIHQLLTTGENFEDFDDEICDIVENNYNK